MARTETAGVEDLRRRLMLWEARRMSRRASPLPEAVYRSGRRHLLKKLLKTLGMNGREMPCEAR
jgi:hypothetical protein